MKIIASDKKADVEILVLKDKELPKNLSKNEKEFLELYNYKGEGSIFLNESKRFLVGITKVEYDFPNALRDAFFNAFNTLKKMNVRSLSLCLENTKECKEALEGILLANYSFDTFKAKKDECKIEEIFIDCKKDKEKLQSAIDEAIIITKAVNKVRELVNTPPKEATAEYVMNFAKNMAEKNGISCKVLDKKGLKEEKMRAFLAVNRASCNEPYMVHLTYKPQNDKKLPKIVFVGKGLTYDCGGLSLKPGDYMTTMKADKSGACAVIGILESVAKLKLEVEVHGILGLAENMIGGNAYKPDDILKARNGKTIEVRNTDAEGRLVLADCLCYASDLNPDFLFDLATLTGACVVALGDYTTGVMGYNQSLKEEFCKCAFKAGELTGILPFNPYLGKLYKSEVADLCNIPSSRYGSSITAGMFLGEFVEEKLHDKWLHLDIAGPAYVEKSWGVNPFGGTGAGVRACVEFIKSKARD